MISFSELSISSKIYLALGTCLLSLIGASAFATYQINQIGKELTAIAEEDIPLTIAITNAASSQLEQTIYFERVLKSALEAELDLPGAEKFETAIERFHAYGDAVETHLHEAEEIAQHGIEHALNDAMSAKFTEVLGKLFAIESEHELFEEHAEEVKNLLRAGDLTNGTTLGEEVDAEAEKLDKEIEALLAEVATFTAQSALIAESHEQAALRWLIILSVATFLTVTPLTIFIVQVSLPKPLRGILSDIDRLASGNIDEEVVAATSDEVGRIAHGLEGFRQSLLKTRELEQQVKEAQEVTVRRADILDKLNAEFEGSIGTILDRVTDATNRLDENARAMSRTSEESSAKSDTILMTADASSQNMASVGSASEEMSASINEIVGQTMRASEAARSAVADAEGLRHQTTQMVENAQSINEVISLISGIAEQTNLLALNATIEAARAGEAGKGFAVVASEVKVLASQTGQATKDISEKIESMQSATEATAKAIDGIVTRIDAVSEGIESVTHSVTEQNSAVGEINQNIQMMSDGSQQISVEVRAVSDSINITGAAAEDVQSAVQQLREEAGTLKSDIDAFLTDVKAA